MLLVLLTFLSSFKASADIYRYPERDIHVSAGVEVQEYILGISNEQSSRELSYTPNLSEIFVPRIAYKDLFSLSWAFDVGLDSSDINLKGNTEYNDIRFNFNFRNFKVSTYYLQYRGFYIDKSQDVDPAFGNGNPEIQLPDLYSRSIGGGLTWVWDGANYSMASLVGQSERQEKSGGSFLFGANFSDTRFENANNIIPTNVQGDFDNLGLIEAGNFTTLSAKGGYGYNLVFWQKWYLGGMIQLGPGLTHNRLRLSNGEEVKGTIGSIFAETLVSLGYNGDRFFSSLYTEAKATTYDLSNTTTSISPQMLSGGLIFGVHLESIGF